MIRATLALLLLLSAHPAQARIGVRASQLERELGAAQRMAQQGDAEYRAYRWEGLNVEVWLSEGYTRQLTYQGTQIDFPYANSILALHAGDSLWTAPSDHPQNQTGGPPRFWLRQDQRAEAELSTGRLLVREPGWVPPVLQPGALQDVPAIADTPEQAAARVSWPPVWVSHARSDVTIYLNILDNGTIRWVEHSHTARNARDGRWQPGEATHVRTARFPVAPASGGDTSGGDAQADVEATLHLEGAQTLRFSSTALPSAIHFQQTESIPRWRALAPAYVPQPGESRESVLQRHGRPSGQMRSGAREKLVYPWGRVVIKDNQVIATE